MKLKRFEQLNEDDDISYFSRYKDDADRARDKAKSDDDDFGSVMGRHFAGDDDEDTSPSTEAELEKYKECIKQIEYTLTHIKKEPYDYGEGADEAISEVMDLIYRVKGGY